MRIDPIKFARKVISSDLSLFTFSNLLVNFINFSSQLLVANILTPADIGYIKLILSVINVLTIASNFGINISILKICSENIEKDTIIKRFKTGNIITIITSSIIILLTSITLYTYKIYFSGNIESYVIILILISILINSIFNNYCSIFQSLRKNKEFSIINITTKIISIFILISFTCFFKYKGYWIAYITSISISILIVIIYFNKTYNTSKKNIILKDISFKIHFKHSKWALLSNIFGQLSLYTDIFIINILSNNKNEIGIYSFATTFVVIIKIIPATIQQYVSPRMSYLGNDIESIKILYKKYNKLIILISITIGVTTIIFIPFIIQYIFPKYIESTKYILLLTSAVIIRNFNIINASILFGFGKIKYNSLNEITYFVLNSFLIFILFNNYGFLSCIISQIITSITIVIITKYQIKHYIPNLNI